MDRTGSPATATDVVALDSLDRVGRLDAAGYLLQGNTYFEQGAIGRAVLAYERGLRLRPANRALRNNLRYVRQEAGLPEATASGFFLLRWWRIAGAALGASLAYSLALVLWWLALAVFFWWYLRRRTMTEQRRFVLLPAATVLLILALVSYALAESRVGVLNQTDEAVLVAPIADLRVSPTEDATVEATLQGGLRFRVTDRVGDFVKVVLADGRQGYLTTAEIVLI